MTDPRKMSLRHLSNHLGKTCLSRFVIGLTMGVAGLANAQGMDKADFKRPHDIPFPAENAYSPEKLALGKRLFFDPRLSANNNINCGSCHNPSLGWEDGQAASVGTEAIRSNRHSQTLLNRAWSTRQNWDGRAKNLEEQAKGPITAKLEMNISFPEVIEKLSNIPGYKNQFTQVFPNEGITEDTIVKSISTFTRTIVSGIAPFDRWVEGQEDAIDDDAKRGFVLFTGKANCVACHTGWNFSDEAFHDIGIDSMDMGLGMITKNKSDDHAFKTPGLRNIEQRAPYMHNGSLESLEDVLIHYISGGTERPTLSKDIKPLDLSSDEMDDLIAFMKSLTGDDRPVTLPILPF